MMDVIVIGSTRLILKRGDITLEDTEAIVNAANTSLMGGGGVDGAIHRAGGPKILEECRAIRQTRGELSVGEAVMTSGGMLKAKHVIHAVGPVWQGGSRNEHHLLANAYRNSLMVATHNKLESIAFPSISTGIYGFPIAPASRIAFNTVSDVVADQNQIREVRFVVFNKDDYQVYLPLFHVQHH